MEEVVGKLWDKWLSKQVSTDFPESAVKLDDIRLQLQVFYRSLGGDVTKAIEPCERRRINIKRTTMQKVAGSHLNYYLSWQDERSVRLPPELAVFPESALNEFLYFWLVALAAHIPTMQDWLFDNQNATRTILRKYPGLNKQYQNLLEAYRLIRPQPNTSVPLDIEIEQMIGRALLATDLISSLPESKFQPYPVPLWLYPAESNNNRSVNRDNDDDAVDKSSNNSKEIKEIKQRKKAQYIDEEKETDGLLIFQAEALATWTEQINLDRTQSDEEEEDADQIAKDMDVINLSRQRKASAAGVRFDMDLPAEENDDLILGEGIPLPEWHYKKNTLVADVCRLQTMITDQVEPVELTHNQRVLSREIQQLFSMLTISHRPQKAQVSGNEIDLDAWLDNYTRPEKDSNKQNFYIDQRYKYRDVSCLILADLSLSTECYVNNDQKVIDIIRDSLMVFSNAMDVLNDAFAIYGFSSIRSNNIRYHIIKNFEMNFDANVRGRIARIEPGFYTRMGAAIRQSSMILSSRLSNNKILLIISDGKPNDLDKYEGRYGIEDTRQAILEARALGLEPFCITVDKKGSEYLPYLFGAYGYAVVREVEQLPKILPKIYANLTHNR